MINCLEEKRIKIKSFELLKYPKFLFASLSATLVYFLFGFVEPILAFRAAEFDLN